MTEELRYFAKDLDEFNCDNCDKHIGYGFIDHCDDCGMLCDDCKKIIEFEQISEVTQQKAERLAREEKERLCGLSTEGHKWEDITSQCLVIGSTVFGCTKCNATKTEPVNFDFIKTLTVSVPELKFNTDHLKNFSS